jgi:thiamine monophosphate kinase
MRFWFLSTAKIGVENPVESDGIDKLDPSGLESAAERTSLMSPAIEEGTELSRAVAVDESVSDGLGEQRGLILRKSNPFIELAPNLTVELAN